MKNPVTTGRAWHLPFLRFADTVDDPTAGGGSEADEPIDDEPIDGEEALGDPGKKALDTMKAERNAARTAERKAAAELAALQAKLAGQEAEHAAQVAAQKVKDDALAAANVRIVKAEIRSAAKGKLADPADALTFIDPTSIEVDDDGNVDTAALDAAIDQLVTQKPYLAAQGGRRFQGDGGGGARTGTTKPPQLTREDVEKLSREGKHAEIVKAREEGRLADLLNA